MRQNSKIYYQGLPQKCQIYALDLPGYAQQMCWDMLDMPQIW